MDVDEKDIDGKSALAHLYLQAVSSVNYKEVKDRALEDMQNLVACKAHLDMPMKEQDRTLIMDAAMRGHIPMFTFLLKAGANRDMRDNIGRHLNDYIRMDFAGKT